MRITDLRLERTAAAARATARVIWESASRPPFDLFFETDGPASEGLAAAPEAFATACLHPAIHRGERRIRLEGPLCPRLAEGLRTAAMLVRGWFGPPREPVEIEAAELRAITPRRPSRCAFFFTGGIDSSHLLHANRNDYSLDHPASFADCISLHGHLRAESEDSPWNARATARLRETAEAARLTLVPIRTNLWHLDPDLPLVTRESLAAGLSAAAQLLQSRWTSVSIASGRDIGSEIPRGTHPLLDPLYSTSALEIRHDPVRLTRFERLRAVAENGSGVGIQSLIVCLTFPGPPNLNCGECEKCVRTMTQLVILGVLPHASTFPHRDVTPEMIGAIAVSPLELQYWEEIVPLLPETGRFDLAAAIEAKLEESRRIHRWNADAGFKGRLRRLDRRLLGGRLLELRRRLGNPGH